jgi:hypothetical protein
MGCAGRSRRPSVFQALSLGGADGFTACGADQGNLSVVKDAQPSDRSVGAPLTRMEQRLFDPVVGLTEAIPSSLVKAMEDGIWSAWSTNAL